MDAGLLPGTCRLARRLERERLDRAVGRGQRQPDVHLRVAVGPELGRTGLAVHRVAHLLDFLDGYHRTYQSGGVAGLIGFAVVPTIVVGTAWIQRHVLFSFLVF